MTIASDAFERFSVACPHRLSASRIVDGGLAPTSRCMVKPKEGEAGARDAAPGRCSQPCGLGQRWCVKCGHREEHHVLASGVPKMLGCCVQRHGAGARRGATRCACTSTDFV